jgi:hypothetical protein
MMRTNLGTFNGVKMLANPAARIAHPIQNHLFRPLIAI